MSSLYRKLKGRLSQQRLSSTPKKRMNITPSLLLKHILYLRIGWILGLVTVRKSQAIPGSCAIYGRRQIRTMAQDGDSLLTRRGFRAPPLRDYYRELYGNKGYVRF